MALKALATRDESVDFDSTWDTLRLALLEIHTKNASKLSFEELYRQAYKLVLKKRGEDLYNKVKGLEEEWLRSEIHLRIGHLVKPCLLISGSSGSVATEKRAAGEQFLKSLKAAWKDHELCMSMITDVLMYMVNARCVPGRIEVLGLTVIGPRIQQ